MQRRTTSGRGDLHVGNVEGDLKGDVAESAGGMSAFVEFFTPARCVDSSPNGGYRNRTAMGLQALGVHPSD
jgi:hypothetical protein